MVGIRVVGPDSLDFGSYVALQREAYAEIVGPTGTGYLLTEPYYRWKYTPPAGGARIALVEDEMGLVAANAMYPLRIRAGDDRIVGWQSCDTATHPRGRGKGNFMKCLAALKSELGLEHLFFGFPNRNSIPGFAKFGWNEHGEVRTWVRALPARALAAFRAIEPIEQFTDEHEAFFGRVVAGGGTMLERDSTYMNWRYKLHPLHSYEAFGWRAGGELLGVLVLRRVKISGRELAIAMETVALSAHAERGMLAFAASWARERRAQYTVALNNTTRTSDGILSGYVPVPVWALPKRQVLMGAAAGTRAQAMWSTAWRMQIGDWDGF